jgi:hypothetical protein
MVFKASESIFCEKNDLFYLFFYNNVNLALSKGVTACRVSCLHFGRALIMSSHGTPETEGEVRRHFKNRNTLFQTDYHPSYVCITEGRAEDKM